MMLRIYFMVIFQFTKFIFCLPCDDYLNNGGALYLENSGHCYVLFTVLEPYSTVFQECGNKGLHVVFLETAAEQTWLESELHSRQFYYVAWTGLRYIGGQYFWVDDFNAITYAELDDYTRVDTGTDPGITLNPGYNTFYHTPDGNWNHYVCESGFMESETTTQRISTEGLMETTAMHVSTEGLMETTAMQISTGEEIITTQKTAYEAASTSEMPINHIPPTLLSNMAQNSSLHSGLFNIVSGQIQDLHYITSFTVRSVTGCIRNCVSIPACNFAEINEISQLCYIYTQDANIPSPVTKTCDGVTTQCFIRQ